PARAIGELKREDVAVRAGVRLLPRISAVGRPVDDAFLAGDPRRLPIEAADGEEGALRAGVLALPGLGPVARMEDATQLADHPAFALVRKAGAEQVLADLAQADRLPGDRGGSTDQKRQQQEYGGQLAERRRGRSSIEGAV